jgi:predicted  nucleic acid-binding Zn-ribbon protein
LTGIEDSLRRDIQSLEDNTLSSLQQQFNSLNYRAWLLSDQVSQLQIRMDNIEQQMSSLQWTVAPDQKPFLGEAVSLASKIENRDRPSQLVMETKRQADNFEWSLKQGPSKQTLNKKKLPKRLNGFNNK